MVVKILENKTKYISLFKNMMNGILEDCEDWDYEFIYQAEELLKLTDDEISKFIICVNDDKIVAIFSEKEIFGKKTIEEVQSYYSESDYHPELVEFIKSNGYSFIIHGNGWLHLYEYFESINYECSFAPENKYQLFPQSTVLCVNNSEKDFIRDSYEAEIFPKITSLDEVSYHSGSYDDIKEVVNTDDYDFPGYWMKENNMPAYVGMYYFNCSYHDDKKYIYATYKNRIIGCIYWGVWQEGTNSEEQAISYIDVSIPYRNMGIATEMVKKLNEVVNASRPLNLSTESEMGKKCGMTKLFKKFITVTKVYSAEEARRY